MALTDSNGRRPPGRPGRDRRRPRVKRKKAPGEKPAQRRPNPGADLWAKANAAARAARLLTDTGDWNGAVNRAYYSVFSGARAALAGVRAALAESKGHGTIVRRFEKHLVDERRLDGAFNRSFFGVLSHARWVADYDAASVAEDEARARLGDAERFLAAIEPFLKKAKK